MMVRSAARDGTDNTLSRTARKNREPREIIGRFPPDVSGHSAPGRQESVSRISHSRPMVPRYLARLPASGLRSDPVLANGPADTIEKPIGIGRKTVRLEYTEQFGAAQIDHIHFRIGIADGDHRQIWDRLADDAQQLQTVHVTHLDTGYNKIKFLAF